MVVDVSQKSGRKPAALDSVASEPKPSDTLLIRGVAEDGESLSVLRAREDRIEAGVVRPLKDGETVMGELVRLKPRPEFPLVCDVEVEVPSRAPALPAQHDRAVAKLSHGGPAQVATPSYRANWDAIWSKPKPDAKPN